MKVKEPFTLLYKYRNLLWQTTRNDIKVRFAGSLLGALWLFFYPLLLLGAYALVYLFIFKVKFQLFDSNEYVALIFCGLIPFLGFSEALSMGVGSVVSNANLMKNTLFPIELVPAKSVLASQSTQVTGMFMLLIVLALLGKWTIFMPLIIIIWILQIMFTMGVIWIISSINVFVRDLQSIISVVVLLLMLVSPIAYTEDMIPENLRPYLAFNPVYYLTVSYQSVLMLGKLPSTHVSVTLVIMSFLTFIVGFWFFTKMKRVFTDNV
ncbi:ABC transporter permease [Schinkia azotoformans]|uniref:ABC transporter permease n=1 Tax=Schinkia azotoformans TaxID=1454 RepID=UPI002DBD6CE9|nr:ABC transporter permease [Schinkia azotoformans]MEC1719149.1 ABC transporter permease [Schinkia azotoformans]MED4413803.1 ABC transporter permease [Schinkia azotoformans]